MQSESAGLVGFCGAVGVLSWPRQGKKFRTGKSGGSGDGVHGGGDAHAAAPLGPAPPRTAAHWAGPSPAPSPPLVQEPESLRPCSPGFPWTAACACGRELWTGEGGSGWVVPGEEGHLGFS